MEGKTILVVDDEADLREAIQTALQAVGANVLVATDGNEGYAIALKEHPDLILMDINMPVMDGHTAVGKIRQDVWGKQAKVIYLTSFSDAANVVTAVEHGSDEYIVKTNMSLEEVVTKCKQVIADYKE